MNQKEELEKAFYMMPIHSDLLDYWKKNLETEPILKAIRFILMSNYTFNGLGGMIVFGASSASGGFKGNFNFLVDKCFNILYKVQFMNKDFRKFFKSIMLDDRMDKGESEQTLIYADPPYIFTTDNYSNSFTESDSIDLFNALQKTGCKYAMSEFNNPFIIDQAKKRGLNIIIIGERQNLKNRRTEILITNYKNIQGSLFNTQEIQKLTYKQGELS